MPPSHETVVESDLLASIDLRRLSNASSGTSRDEAAESQSETPLPGTASGLPEPLTLWDRWLVRWLVSLAKGLPLEICLWNGQSWNGSEAPAEARMTLRSPEALRNLFRDPSLGFGDGYMQGEITVSGDLVRFCEIVELASRQSPRWFDNRMWRWLHWLTPNTRSAARDHIRHHYDLGNEFYRLWLDEEMAYTCAYFPRPDLDLASAQRAKFDHVARKLRLQPGMQVVEAGCGWGGLAIHLAREYGVSVQAYNISREQVAFARQRVRQAGLEGRVTVIEDDWRTIGGQYDAFVSVGMLEHVGPENFRELGRTLQCCLKPEGLGLLHTIGRNAARPMDRWTEKRIFPGGCPPSLQQMAEIFEAPDFSVLDVENLRLHYARTLEFWRDNFEAHVDQIESMFDQNFVRMWRLYLSASIAAFRMGGLQLFQVVFAHGRNNAIPWTRGDLYASSQHV